MSKHAHSPAGVCGRTPPALSISFDAVEAPNYMVLYSECQLDVPEEEWPEPEVICLGCLVEEGDEQLGRGLDLARKHGQVDWDTDAAEWFVPPPGQHWQTCDAD